MSYTLVQEHIAKDCVEAFKELHVAAATGQIIGAGIVVMLKRRRFFVDTCGEGANDPHLMRGLLRALDDELCEVARGTAGPRRTL